MKEDETDVVLAAGALVWRVSEAGELEVLAVHRPRYNDWSWPKGKLDKGETLPACAVREVAEETRVHVELGPPLPTLRYPVGGGRTKVVKYWTARVLDKDAIPVTARAKVKRASKNEIDEVRWLTVAEAKALITLAEDLRLLKRLVAMHEKGRLKTRTFIVARHARAKRRKGWTAKDVRRPITKGGQVRAAQLVGLFAAFGVTRVASSTALRCVQTVHPYAEAAGIPVRGFGTLREQAFADKPDATVATFEELVRKKRSRVVCVHRPTLPALMDVLRRFVVDSTAGSLPHKMPFLPAGGVLVLHVVNGGAEPEIVAVEKHFLKPRRT